MRKFFGTTTLAVIGILLAGAGTAAAVTADYYTEGSCATSPATFTVTGAGSFDECYGYIVTPPNVNDSGLDLKPGSLTVNSATFGNGDSASTSSSAVTGLFGITNWTVVSKYEDEASSITEGDTTTGLSYSAGGLWSINDDVLTDIVFMAIVKQSNTLAAYRFDPISSVTGGIWGSNDGNALEDISHMTFFISGTHPDDPNPAPIPLPAAGWMLLAGLGGLVAMKRRKKADA